MTRRVSLVPALAIVVGCVSATAIVVQSPANQSDQAATVVGRLEVASKTYFRHAKFAIVDDHNNRVFVTAWAPLEVPPSPSPNPAAERVSTMRDYVGKRLAVTGIYRSARDFPHAATAIAAPDASFLDVTSVKDVERGIELFRGRPRFVAPQPNFQTGSESVKPGPAEEAPQSTRSARPAPPSTEVPAASQSTTAPRFAAPRSGKPIEPAPAAPQPRAAPGVNPQAAPSPTSPQQPATAPPPAQPTNPAPPQPQVQTKSSKDAYQGPAKR